VSRHAGPLIHRPLPQAVAILAVPVLVEQLLNLSVGLFDTYLTGRYLPADYLAAIGLMSYLLWGISSILGGVSIGTTAVVSRLAGANRLVTANRAANQSLGIAFVVGLGLWLILARLGPALVASLQLRGVAGQAAEEYLRWMLPILPLMAIGQVGMAAWRGLGNTLTGLGIMLIVNVVNVLVSVALVTGWGGLPVWGWQGLVVGTATGYAVSGLLVLGLWGIGHSRLRLQVGWLWPRRRWMARIFSVGLPAGMDMFATVACHLWFLGIINALGTLAAAAHAVAVRVESLAYTPCTAFQAAAATLAGQSLGARQPQRGLRAVGLTCLAAVVTLAAVGLLFAGWAEPLVGLFLSPENRQPLQPAAELLRLVAWFLPMLAVANVLASGLRGAGDARGPLAITFICFLGVRIPLTYLLAPSTDTLWLGLPIACWGWGVLGAWWAMGVDLTLRALLVSWRFAAGPWRRV